MSRLPDSDEELIISVDVNLLGALGFSPGRETGDDFDADPAVMTGTGKLPANGRLSGDVEFALVVNGSVVDDIVVRVRPAGSGSVEGLTSNLNAAREIGDNVGRIMQGMEEVEAALKDQDSGGRATD